MCLCSKHDLWCAMHSLHYMYLYIQHTYICSITINGRVYFAHLIYFMCSLFVLVLYYTLMNLCIFGGAKLSLYQAIVCENIRNTFCNFMKFASIKSIHNNSKITAKTHISLALQNRTKQKKMVWWKSMQIVVNVKKCYSHLLKYLSMHIFPLAAIFWDIFHALNTIIINCVNGRSTQMCHCIKSQNLPNHLKLKCVLFDITF